MDGLNYLSCEWEAKGNISRDTKFVTRQNILAELSTYKYRTAVLIKCEFLAVLVAKNGPVKYFLNILRKD